MNPMVVPVLAIGAAFFGVGLWWGRWVQSRRWRLVGWLASVALSAPGLVFALYYFKVLGEPIWLYRLRALTGSELLASGFGLLAGWAQAAAVPRLRLSVWGRKLLAPGLFGFLLLLPYLKPLVRPVQLDQLQDAWRGGVCLQTSASTCGPACGATLLRLCGQAASERALAKECYTSGSGTENWYLIRALRRRGVRAEAARCPTREAQCPAIAGVRLGEPFRSGHFVVLLESTREGAAIGDPLEGCLRMTWVELEARYRFTGFFLLAAPKPPGEIPGNRR